MSRKPSKYPYVIADEPELRAGKLPPELAFAFALMGPGRDADEPEEWPDVMAYVRETTKDLERKPNV